jgi:hypothetical protein
MISPDNYAKNIPGIPGISGSSFCALDAFDLPACIG